MSQAPVGQRSAHRPQCRQTSSSLTITRPVCGNTLETLTVKEGKRPPLMEGVNVAQVGVAALMEFAEKNWTIVRP